MASRSWIGGASLTQQISTITLNNDTDDSETALTVTMTNEGGGTQQESITPSGTDESVIAAALQAALAASTQSLFTAVTWTVASGVVTGTAKTAGIPFYFSSAYTGGAGTTTDATGTANSGPNDWNTAANWSASTKPVDGDDVRFNEGSYSVLYGLDQSGIDLKSFRRMPGFTGDLGRPADGYFLQIDSSNTGGSNTPKTNISSVRGNTWLKGTHDSLTVQSLPNHKDAFRFSATSSARVVVSGPRVQGRVHIASSSTITGIYFLNCPGATLYVDTNCTLSTIRINGGTADLYSSIGTLDMTGGTVRMWEAGAISSTIDMFGGEYQHNSSGTITAGNIYGGTVTLEFNQEPAVTVTNMSIFGGLWTDITGTVNVTYTNPVFLYGGVIQSLTATVTAVL